MKRTALSLTIFTLLATLAIGVNVLSAQDTISNKNKTSTLYEIATQEFKPSANDIINIRAKEEGFPEVATREEALEIFKRDNQVIRSGYFFSNKLPNRFQEKLKRLKEIYSDTEIFFRYLDNPSEIDYQGNYLRANSPLYIGELTTQDKHELIDLGLRDSVRAITSRYGSRTYPVYFFSIYDLGKEFANGIMQDANYIMFYEAVEFDRSEIYDIEEVDINPAPVGGLAAFERAIALDTKVPEGIIKENLPETIDFTITVNGGKQISNVNLLTKVKGKDKNNDELNLFFGQLIRHIQNKTRSFYSWKSGQKNGKEVRVRMKISIPTKYMM